MFFIGLLHDVIQEKHSKAEELHVVAIDCEKAFDSVRFDAILNSVKGSPLKGIIMELVCFQRLRIHGTNLWMYPGRGTPHGGIQSTLLLNSAIEVLQTRFEVMPNVMVGGLSLNKLQ